MLEPLVTLGVRCTTSEESGVQSVLVAFVGDWSILFRVFHCFDFFEFGTNVSSCSVSVNLESITVQYVSYIISSHWIVNSELQNERAENVVARVPLMNYQTSKLCFQMQDSKTSCHVLSTGLGPESWLRLSHSMKVLFTTTWQMNSSCKAHMALQASDSMVRDGPWWSVMVRDGPWWSAMVCAKSLKKKVYWPLVVTCCDPLPNVWNLFLETKIKLTYRENGNAMKTLITFFPVKLQATMLYLAREKSNKTM